MYEGNSQARLAAAAAQHSKEKNYWLRQLSGELEKTGFPPDYKKTSPQDCCCQQIQFRFPDGVFSRLTWLSSDSDYTLHIYLTASTVVLLNKYTGNRDIIIATPIYKQEIEGKFINTVLPLRSCLKDDMTFKELIMALSETIVSAEEHQSYPLDILAKQLNIPFLDRDFHLFDTAVLLENIHDKEYLEPIHHNIIFSFLRTHQSIRGIVEYNADLYNQSTIQQIITHIKELMEQALFNLETRLTEIDILTGEEREHILTKLNDTRTGFPRDKTIHELFEQQAELRPDKTVLIFRDTHLTYNQLNTRANRLAGYLRSKGVKPGHIIGLMVKRSPDMIIGILGILKAGGAYLPLEQGMPVKRLLSMLEDCRVYLLLTNSDLPDNRAFTQLQGLHARGGPGQGIVHVTPSRPQVLNFDGLPFPDRSLVNYETYNRYISQAPAKHVITLQGTRGCPYQCAYCHKLWPKRHVARSAGNIFAEVQQLYRVGIRRFALLDDIFNLDRKNSAAFFEKIIKNRMDIQLFFPSGMRGDILTGEYIDLMIEAGTVHLPLALETASPRLQKLIGKNLDIEKLRRNIRYIAKKYPQLILELYSMVGFPTETESEALETLEFIKSIRWFHFPYIFILKIWSNTKMAQLAIENGISVQKILNSDNLAYHQVSDTLPFEKKFARELQADFFNDYFMSKERLLHVLPYQMQILSEDEIVQKYNSYLPTDINCFADLLKFTGIAREEIKEDCFLDETKMAVPNINEKFQTLFPARFPAGEPGKNALRVLLLDLSQFFSHEKADIYNVVEAPLGLMALLTYLHRELGSSVRGKIAKAFVDFTNYEELEELLDRFKPDVIGIRTLTYYKDFFHQTVTRIRQWGFDGPLIAGGPYATSNTPAVLRDRNIDIAVLGEGEITFCQVIREIIKNKGKLPEQEILKEIKGIAFIPGPRELSPRFSREIILLDALENRLSRRSPLNPEHLNRTSDQVYTMYTSGTTGTPKGTLTTHANVIRVVKDTNYIDINKDDRVLQLSNYAFDGSVFDIYGVLINGGSLVMMKQEDLMTLHTLSNLIKREKISVFFLTTALFNALVDMQMDCFSGNRKILFGGEKISVPHTKKALDYLGPNRLIHVYGPTETTVYATYYFINDIDPRCSTIPIGKPISNTSVYIRDKGQRLLPVGISGELVIGGAGVAAGYLNQPELTREKFPENPYRNSSLDPDRENHIVYCTGDICRWLQGGDIEFCGRIDHQVKLRGFRVEMGEIVNQLLKYNGIKEALALVTGGSTTALTPGSTPTENEGEDKFICAYITTREEVDQSELRNYLTRELPEYMVPAYIVQLEHIPLNPNGKVDRKMLPNPRSGSSGDAYTAPRHEGEKRLVEIWQQVLNLETVGIDDDFFENGGHSLKAVKLINMIHKQFNVKLNFTDIFQFPTIAALYEHIRASNITMHQEIETQPEKEYYRLSYSQRRLWVLYELAPHNPAFNITENVMLYEELEEELLTGIFEKLLHRHDSFRTYFIEIDGEPRQIIPRKGHVRLELIDLSHLDEEECEKERNEHIRIESMQPFNLHIPPLFRVKLIKCRKDCYELIFTMHHIISDGWSMELLEKEFLELYEAYKKGHNHDFPPLKKQYKDYVYWHNRLLADDEKMQAAKEFWEKQLGHTGSNGLPVPELPYDFLKKNLKSKESAAFRLVIPREVIEPLRTMGQRCNASLFIVLLTGFNIFLSQISRQTDIVLAVPGAARPHEDLKNIVGFFVNTLILRNRVDPGESFMNFLERVRDNTLQVLEYQDYPMELICSQLKIKYPELSVFFNMSTFGNQNRKPLKNLESYHLDFVQNAKFDLVCYLTEYKNGVEINAHYYKQLFKPGKIEKLMHVYVKILGHIARDPGNKINVYSAPERKLKVKL